MESDPVNKYVHILIENKEKNEIVAIGSLIIETHLTGKIGLIENIVVGKNGQRKGFGKKIMDMLDRVGLECENCYKLSLYCKD